MYSWCSENAVSLANQRESLKAALTKRSTSLVSSAHTSSEEYDDKEKELAQLVIEHAMNASEQALRFDEESKSHREKVAQKLRAKAKGSVRGKADQIQRVLPSALRENDAQDKVATTSVDPEVLESPASLHNNFFDPISPGSDVPVCNASPSNALITPNSVPVVSIEAKAKCSLLKSKASDLRKLEAYLLDSTLIFPLPSQGFSKHELRELLDFDDLNSTAAVSVATGIECCVELERQGHKFGSLWELVTFIREDYAKGGFTKALESRES